MYKSPIEILTDDVELFVNNEVFTAVQRVGVNVDKEELLRALQYDRGQYAKGYADGKADAAPEWISVTERLPEEPLQTVLVTNGSIVCVGVYSVVYEEFGVMCGRGQDKRFGVTHWMPLPQPPKGE